MEQTIEICKDKDFKGLCFVNLVDFDACGDTGEIRWDMGKSWSALMRSLANSLKTSGKMIF